MFKLLFGPVTRELRVMLAQRMLLWAMKVMPRHHEETEPFYRATRLYFQSADASARKALGLSPAVKG